MFWKLFAAFTLIPAVEIYLFILAGKNIGAFPTILLIIFTGFLGAFLARIQGTQTFFRIRSAMDQGIMPTEDLLDALLIFVAGIVLLTPGFLTDLAGISLLFPPTRSKMKGFVKRKIEGWIRQGNLQVHRYP